MNDELMHFGILGMKWGVRRYQKEDGTRTKLGKEHRAETEGDNEKEDKAKAEKTRDQSRQKVVEVEASKVFTKDELDAMKNNDDPELLELMLMEVVDATGYSDGEFEFDKSWEDELEKFRKDPHNYTFRFKGYSEDELYSDTSSDELMHYGILGMKWGIRRFQKENGSLTKAGRERYGVGDGYSNNAKSGQKSNLNAGASSEAESKPKARPASEMSDEELRTALNRLDMERRYNELTNPIRNDQRNNVDDRDYTMLPRSVTNVSNADLDAYIKRIRLEQEYSKLTAPPPKELTAGQKFMKEFAGPILATVAKEYVTKALKRAVGLEGDNNNKNNNNNGDNDKLNKRLNNIENSINSLRNNNNGGGKESKRQSKEEKKQEKNMDKRFDELKAMISDGIKSNLPVAVDNSGSPSAVKSPTPVRPTYTERRNSLLGATSKAVQTSKQNQRYREQLISDLAKRREQRAERERKEQRSEYNRAVRQDRIDSFINSFRNSSPSYDLDTYPRMWRQ